MNWETYRKKLLKKKGFKEALAEVAPEYQIARAMVLARQKHNLTQKDLANRLKTKQSVVSRVENMQTTATVSFLNRFAKAFGAKLEIRFNGI